MAYRRRWRRRINARIVHKSALTNNLGERLHFVVIEKDYYNRSYYLPTNNDSKIFQRINDAIEYAIKCHSKIMVVGTIYTTLSNQMTIPFFMSCNTNGIIIFHNKNEYVSPPFKKMQQAVWLLCASSVNKRFKKKTTIERPRKNSNEKSEDVLRG